jgi:hypothetical protein
MNTYKNRYGDQFTFTLDSDKNILWEGNFNFCRIGYPNDYLKAYDKYCKDHIENFYNGERMSLDDFKEAVRDIKQDMKDGFNKIDNTLGLIFKKLEHKEDKE